MCGNIFISDEIIQLVRESLDTAPAEEVNHIESFVSAKKKLREQQFKDRRRKRLKSSYTIEEQGFISEERKWKQINLALKVRSINKSIGMHKSLLQARGEEH